MFSLNKLQKKAFLLDSHALLRKIAEGYGEIREMKTKAKPLTMYLSGEGGTGGTKVIEALLFFSRSWQRPKAVRTCAPTGRAASLVQGQTVHSLLGIRAGRSFSARKRMSQKVKDEHLGAMMLIVDEISMLSRRNLGAIDVFLRQVKECDIPFGGIIVIFSGDFFQIPPVASESVYSNPITDVSGVLDIIGYQLWQNIEHAIILEESMRHAGDHKYAECLRRVRVGATTADDLELLNTRVITKDDLKSPALGEKGNVHLVVRTNDLRMFLNWKAVDACSKASGVKAILCVAEVRTTAGQYLPSSDIELLMNANDSQTSNMAILLLLLPHMPVRFTQNFAVDLGIANGAEGVFEGLSFEPETTLKEAVFFGVDCLLCSKLPKVAYIRSELFLKTMPIRFPDLPNRYTDDTIPISPMKLDDVTLKTKQKLRSQVKITIKQLPFVPAFSSTTYKVQGSTAMAVVTFPFVRGCRGAPPRASLYVVLSPVRRLSALFLTETIRKEDLQLFVPSAELVKEEKRLAKIHERTVWPVHVGCEGSRAKSLRTWKPQNRR